MPYEILKPRLTTLAALLAALALPTTGCDLGSTAANTEVADEPFTYTVDVVDQVRLGLEGVNGTIKVTGVVDATSVTIEGTKLVWSTSQADAEAGLDELEVVIDEAPDEFLVYTEQPETGTRAYAVDYEIRLPDHFEVSILNVNGDVTVEFIKDNVEIASVNANIRLDEVEGNVSGELVNGDFAAEITIPLNGAVDIAVGTGDITLEVPTNTSAEVYLEVACCGWDFDNIELQNVETSGPGVWPPTVTGTLGDGQGTISLAIVNGIITVIGV